MSNKDKFNRYCASTMGYKTDTNYPELFVYFPDEAMPRLYSPYDDLNQRTPVFDKLWQMEQLKSLQMTQSVNKFKADLAEHGIDKATKNLIISTMPEDP